MSSLRCNASRVAAALWLFAVSAHAAPERDVAAAIDRHDYAAAAEQLRANLAVEPDDNPARFMLARVLAWSGDYAGAIAEYDRLLAAHPDDVDYVFGRAQALDWAGRYPDALVELERARALAPDYEDVWRVELTVLERNAADPPRLAAFRDQAAGRFPQAQWWRRPERAQSGAEAAATSFTAGAVHESLSTDAPDWSSLFVQVERRRDGGGFHAGVSRDERFGLSDETVSGGADWKVSGRWTTGFDVGVGMDADFAPQSTIGGWALRSWPHAWETEFRIGRRVYSDAAVASSAVTVGRYFGNFRAAYRLDLADLEGAATSAAHSVTLNYYRSSHMRLNLVLVEGQEAESVGPGQVLRTDVSGFTVGARHGLGERLSFSWWLGTHRQGNLYRRRYVGVSITSGL